jgi:hypothetical protein
VGRFQWLGCRLKRWVFALSDAVSDSNCGVQDLRFLPEVPGDVPLPYGRVQNCIRAYGIGQIEDSRIETTPVDFQSLLIQRSRQFKFGFIEIHVCDVSDGVGIRKPIGREPINFSSLRIPRSRCIWVAFCASVAALPD